MVNFPGRGNPVHEQSRRGSLTASRRRILQRAFMDQLEDRTLLAYGFSYNPAGHVATANGNAATDALVVSPIGGLLQHSVNGSAFDSDWGGLTVPASVIETVNVNLSTGDGSSLQLGGNAGANVGGAASLLTANFNVVAVANTADTVTIDDSAGITAAPTYTVNLLPGTISGPGIVYNESASAAFQGGVTIKGATTTANTYNVLSVCCGGATHEPVNVTGGVSTSTVNVGSGGTLAINSTLAIFGFGGTTNVNVNNTSDVAHGAATLNNLSGNVNAPFQVTGLSNAAIEFGTGITAVNINGGRNGAAGVTYNVDSTQTGTALTITGGTNQNFVNLSNAGLTGGLDNLPGAIVFVGGASHTDVVTLDDSSANFNDNYTVASTTVTRSVFGGLTYSNLGTLTLNAENTLGTNGNNTIAINSTANGVTTNVRGQGGVDTVNINNTGTTGALNVTLGSTNGGTVNVIATNEPVNIVSSALSTVNVGSTGGAGTMENILGAISISDPPSFISVILHDENDVTARTWTLDNNDGATTGSIAVSGGIAATNYNPDDIGSLTIYAGSGGNTFTVNNTTGFASTTLNTGTGTDTVNVLATGNNTLNLHGQGGADTVTLGANAAPPLGMQGLNGTISVNNSLGFTTLVLDDALDVTARTPLLFNDGTTGQITGLAPATINYSNTDTGSLTVHGGSGGNTFTVNGTLANNFVPNTPTTLDKGSGASNTVNVWATNAGSALDLTGTGAPDTVNIGHNGSLAGILGTIAINEAPGSTSLSFDFSSDAHPHILDLSSRGTTSILHDELGNLVSDISYTTGSLRSVTFSADGSQDVTLNVDFSGAFAPANVGAGQFQPFNAGPGGNPIPSGSPGLIFNAGNGAGAHALNLTGQLPTGAFASETHNANDGAVSPHTGQYGSISFDDGMGLPGSLTSLIYTGLQPINDTTPAVLYTFNDMADDQSFTVQNGPLVLGLNTVQFVNTPAVPPATFETTSIANKTNVVFNTTTTTAGVTGRIDIATASTGLASLAFNTITGQDNTVSLVNTPAGVAASLVGGSDEDVTNVSGAGVAAGTILQVNGAGSFNTLNYDAGGLVPTITAGALPGEVLISVPGTGTVDALGYAGINIINVAPLVLTPGPAKAIIGIAGTRLVDQIIGTFTAPLLLSQAPAGLAASNFTASIDWGDPSVDSSAGIITRDASSPSIYYITGSHTFAAQGVFTVASTIAFAGGSYSATVNGVPISVTLPAAGPTAGASATATVAQSPLTAGAPVVLTPAEGVALSGTVVGTFTDTNIASPANDFAAIIDWGDGSPTSIGNVVATAPGAFSVHGTHVFKTVGIYAITIAGTDVSGQRVRMTATATVTDPAATGAAVIPVNAIQGQNTGQIAVAIFTDPNRYSTVSDWNATINWGDGTALDTGNIVLVGGAVGGGSVFKVFGSHTYAHLTAGANPTLTPVIVTLNDVDTPANNVVVTGPVARGVRVAISSLDLNFAAPISYSSLNQPGAVVSGDLNGDGYVDMVSADKNGNISTFINRRNTSFQHGRRTNVGGSGPVDLVLGDVNGDGKLDVITANSVSGNVSVLFGNGKGAFAAPHVYKAFANPAAVRLGDVNGDSKADIVVTNTKTGKMSYLLNKGNGTFASVKSFSIPGGAPVAFNTADFNGDGKLDLVTVSNAKALNVDILLGNGSGGFTKLETRRVGLHATSIKIDDVDNDGVLDIVATNPGSKLVSVLLGKGGGHFSDNSRTNYIGNNVQAQVILAADLNSDGYEDLLIGNAGGDTLGVMLGNGNGTFQTMAKLQLGKVATGQAHAIATADFNNDGLTDIVVASAGFNEVSVFFNSRPGHGDNSGMGIPV